MPTPPPVAAPAKLLSKMLPPLEAFTAFAVAALAAVRAAYVVVLVGARVVVVVLVAVVVVVVVLVVVVVAAGGTLGAHVTYCRRGGSAMFSVGPNGKVFAVCTS